jgi:hypothetical protein
MLVIGSVVILAGLAVFGLVDSAFGVATAFLLLMLAANVAQAAQQGFIPDRVEPGRRGVAAGAKGFADVGGAFIGFLLLGTLLAAGEQRTALIALGAVVVIALVLTVLLVDESDRARWGESSRSTVGVLAALVTAWVAIARGSAPRATSGDGATLHALSAAMHVRRQHTLAAARAE